MKYYKPAHDFNIRKFTVTESKLRTQNHSVTPVERFFYSIKVGEINFDAKPPPPPRGTSNNCVLYLIDTITLKSHIIKILEAENKVDVIIPDDIEPPIQREDNIEIQKNIECIILDKYI